MTLNKLDAVRAPLILKELKKLLTRVCGCRAAQHARNAPSQLAEDAWFGNPIAKQQKHIRMGLGQLAGKNRRPQPRRQNIRETSQHQIPSQAMPPVWSQP